MAIVRDNDCAGPFVDDDIYTFGVSVPSIGNNLGQNGGTLLYRLIPRWFSKLRLNVMWYGDLATLFTQVFLYRFPHNLSQPHWHRIANHATDGCETVFLLWIHEFVIARERLEDGTFA